MGKGLEVLSGHVTNTAALGAVTMESGDSLTVRNFTVGTRAQLAAMWGKAATAGIQQVRSPRFHDNVRGIRTRNLATTARDNLPVGLAQNLYPQDTMILESQSGAADSSALALLLYYDDVPGADARLATWEEVLPRIRNVVTVEESFNTSGTVGAYSGGESINTDSDLLKANVDYALLGYLVDVAVASVVLRGPDTGNLRVGGPGSTERLETRDWFIRLSQRLGVGCIPIINAANKGATFIDATDNAATTAVNIDLIMAELG